MRVENFLSYFYRHCHGFSFAVTWLVNVNEISILMTLTLDAPPGNFTLPNGLVTGHVSFLMYVIELDKISLITDELSMQLDLYS